MPPSPPYGRLGAPEGRPVGFGVRFRIALAGRALRVSMFEMTGSEMIGRVPSETFSDSSRQDDPGANGRDGVAGKVA